jgi:hypothetical protein
MTAEGHDKKVKRSIKYKTKQMKKGPFKMKKSPAELRIIKRAVGGALGVLGLGNDKSNKTNVRKGFGGQIIKQNPALGMGIANPLALGDIGNQRRGMMIAAKPLLSGKIGQVGKAFKGANLRGMFRTR